MINLPDPFAPETPPAPLRGIWTSWPLSRLLILIGGLVVGNFTFQVIFFMAGGGLLLPVLGGGLLGVLLPLYAVGRSFGLDPVADFGLDQPPRRVLMISLLFAGAALIPTSFLAELSLRLFPASPEALTYFQDHLPRTPGGYAMAFLSVVVVGPLVEELVYRGLLHRLLSSSWGPVYGAVASSLLFGLMHFQLWLLFGLMGVGLVLAFIHEHTGSVTACWVTHAAHNGLTLVFMMQMPEPTAEAAGFAMSDYFWLGGSLVALVWLGRWLMENGRPGRSADPA